MPVVDTPSGSFFEASPEVPQIIEGGQSTAVVQDNSVIQLLLEVIIELKKMNLYLSEMSDTEIKNSDTEEGEEI